MRGSKVSKIFACSYPIRSFIIWAVSVVFITISNRSIFGCEVTDVWLFINRTEEEVTTSNNKYLYFCDPNTAYWFRVKWRAKEGGVGPDPGEDNNFHVEVHDVTEDISLWEEEHIEDEDPGDTQQEVHEVNSPAQALQEGVHTLRGYARRRDVGEWVEGPYDPVGGPIPVEVAFAADPCAPMASLWEKYVVTRDCPDDSNCSWSTDPSTDGCGNQLKVTCETISGICAYRYWYKAEDANSWTEIGWCPWVGGKNQFWYRVTLDGMRFCETQHYSCNNVQGVDADDEGCDGWFCWKFTKYDCFSGEKTVTWERNTSTTCPCIQEGEPVAEDSCPGPDPNTGLPIHRGYPN
jgi:hypothetical protein